ARLNGIQEVAGSNPAASTWPRQRCFTIGGRGSAAFKPRGASPPNLARPCQEPSPKGTIVRILVVEDEKKNAAFLKRGLVEHGFDVEVARQGEEGLRRALAGHFDLLILDVMLPQRDGWSLLAELTRQGRRTPVLFLSARDAVADRVQGLELGADGYLVKRCAFSELRARVHSVLRRRAAAAPETLTIADREIDLVRHRATRGGRRLDLTPREFKLLALLARHSGEILSRE